MKKAKEFQYFKKALTANTRLAQWGLMFYNQKSGYYCAFMVADSLVFQNPPLRQSLERCGQR